jgi:outer membrane biosynthesis protein TonB
MPWRLTAVGVVLVLLTAFVGGFVVAYLMGGSGWRRAVSPTAPAAPAASTSPVAAVPKAVAAPAPAAAPKVSPAPAAAPATTTQPPAAPTPPKVAPAAEPPKMAAAPVPTPAPSLPAPAPAAVKRPRPEPAPAPASKPRTTPAAPTQADVDACARYATVQAEEHDKAAEDDPDRKAGDAYQKAYASCMQARGYKKTRSDD